jgi:pullulanase
MFRYDEFGAHDDNGTAVFSVFLPGPDDYSRGGDPKIAGLKVFGTFQSALGDPAWSAPHALMLEPNRFEGGTLYQARTTPLKEGFYEYKYLVAFENGERRIVSDPCARYGGGDFENSGIVIGGSQPADNIVAPLPRRLEPHDLVIYELMIDDFTHHLGQAGAPVDMVVDKLDYIWRLGFNAIEFMPWTAWVANQFSWGYMPYLYFAPEHRYVNDPAAPAEKLSRLKRLITQCHELEMHVIMDGVFNHVDRGPGSLGFPYYWLYQNPMDSPFIGRYGDAGYGDEIDFNNSCAQQFIGDVCAYWIDTFGIDGLRLDYTKGFYIGENATGLPKLIGSIREHLETKDADYRTRFPIFIEHLEGYGAIDVANRANATGCWYDEMLWRTRDYLTGWRIDDKIMRLLDSGRDFQPGRVPATYVENHDHSEIVGVAGGRRQWYRAQPYLIALLTCFGAPLLYNGQEFAEDYTMPEGHEETQTVRRVVPRPKRWELSEDDIGLWMRQLVARLIAIRKRHPALRSSNFYPANWEPWMRKPDPDGYGVDVEKQTVVYHRWGTASDGEVERVVVALNFSPLTQTIDVPLPGGGSWEDLMSGWRVMPTDGLALRHQSIGGNWGHVFYNKGN